MKKEINAEDIAEHSLKNPIHGKYSHHAKSENPKVKITMCLDLDICNYILKKAGEADADRHQTQINEELRYAMGLDRTGKSALLP